MRTLKTTIENETVKVTYFVTDTFSKEYSVSKFESDSKESCDKFIAENQLKGYATYAVAQFEVEGSVEGETVAMTIEQAIREIEDAMFIKVVEEETTEVDVLEVLNGDDEGAKDEIAPIIKRFEKNFMKYEVREDKDNWFVNFNTGLGWGQYPKDSFTLQEAIDDDNF